MDAAVILTLLSNLYRQLLESQQEIAALRADLEKATESAPKG